MYVPMKMAFKIVVKRLMLDRSKLNAHYKKSVDFTVKYLAYGFQLTCRYFYERRTFLEIIMVGYVNRQPSKITL